MSQPAGYSPIPLPQKLGIGPGDTVALVGAPGWLEDALAEVPGVADMHTGLGGHTLYDVIVAFVSWRAELEAELGRLRDRMAPACRLWIAWPEQASKAPTDMSENVVRDVASTAGLAGDQFCAIDQTWSALRLTIRRRSR